MQTPTLRIGFGTWPLGGRSYGAVEESVAIAAIEKAIELGVRLFDTANIYGDGRAEDLLGRTIATLDDAIIVSKAGYLTELDSRQDFSEEHLLRSVEGSLKRLRRSQLDILLLHSPPKDTLLNGTVCEALNRIREEGIAAQTGVSLRTLDDFEAALACDGCTTIEMIFNLLDQRPIDLGLPEKAAQQGTQIIARVPLCFGFLSGLHQVGATYSPGDQRNRWSRDQLDAWISGAEHFCFLSNPNRSMTQAALAFCIAWPSVSYAIPGMKTPEQVEHNVAAAHQKCQLSETEIASARHVWNSLKHVPPG